MDTVIEPRGIHRRTVFEVTESLRLRFEPRVLRLGPDDCWPWMGAMRNGYGCIKHDKQCLGSHVVAFVIAYGPVPEGKLVTHDCDNRPCCNPKHLKAGTFTSNVVEMFDRRRVAKILGAAAWNAKLDEGDVRLIHALRIGGYSYQRIANILGYAKSTVKNAGQQRTWKHIAKPTSDEATVIIREANI